MAKFPLTWDAKAKAGYLYLRNTEEKVAKTVELEDPRFLLDLNEQGRIIGIEFLSDVYISEVMEYAEEYATRSHGEIITNW